MSLVPGVVEIAPFEAAHSDGVARLCSAEGWESWTNESVAEAFGAHSVPFYESFAQKAKAGDRIYRPIS